MNKSSQDEVLRAEDLSVSLGGNAVLHGVSLAVGPGEWLSVIGPNGAGKSTLLRALAGLVPSRGRVTFGGGRVPGPRDVALVPQSPRLPDGMSVAEYVLLGRTAHLGWLARESRSDRDTVAAVLSRLDLVAFAHRPVTELSGGEAQRVVVARALAQQTPVILLDEPTSALDVGHQSAMLDLLVGLCRDEGIAVVAAMHDLAGAAAHADQMILLASGRVLVAGAPSAVIDEAVLSEAYGAAVRVRRIDGELVVLPPASARHGAGPRPSLR